MTFYVILTTTPEATNAMALHAQITMNATVLTAVATCAKIGQKETGTSYSA